MRRVPSSWQQDDPAHVFVWHPASPPRAIDGPLPLACFEGRRLVLELAPDQLACREQDGQLAQVFLDGVHQLEIGRGPGQVCPSSRLVFLRPDVALDLRWRHDDELVLVADDPAASPRGGRDLRAFAADQHARSPHCALHLPLRGTCRLHLADPLLFYRCCLLGLRDPAPQHLLGILDAFVRTQLAAHLRPLLRGGNLDRLHAQTMLADLGGDDLGDDLAEVGLGCLHLAAYLPLGDEEPTTVCEPAGAVLSGSYEDLL